MTNHVERAYRAWPILVSQAMNHAEPITYGELAARLNIHHRAVRYVLGVIQSYCLLERLPPLTILVVDAITRRPGTGFIAWAMDDLDRGKQEVREYAWGGLENPFRYASDGTNEGDLVKELVDDPDSSDEIFSRIKVRGMAQVIFRKALLRVYKGRCAFCGLTFEDALEAAHLIPWGESSPKERLHAGNGILLCSTHHGLFDAGLITISRSGIITYRDPDGDDGPYSKADKMATVSLHGKRPHLPIAKEHQPSERALARHHEIHKWGDLL